jgi:hypothetical protein
MKFILLALCWLSVAATQTNDLRTFAEKSGWQKTGRAIEAETLCNAFQKTYPKQISCHSYGKTPQGRNLLYVVAGDRNPNNPVLWVQAGIHAGEIDGKDAVFWLLKDILEKKITPDPLKGVTIIFIPIVNVDGHERFGKWNRPNQIGPEEMGWRTTANNLNLNRDFLKAEASEMQDLIKLWIKNAPLVSLDLHVTNGAHFEPELGIIVTPTDDHGTSSLHRAGKFLENGLMQKLKERNHLALPFYPDFQETDRPQTGFARVVHRPRFANGYWFAQNRIGVLVESHSWKDYATRVKAHYSTVLSTLELVQEKGNEWKQAAKEADQEKLAGKEVALIYQHNGKARPIEFPGFKYKIEKSAISGGEVIKYFTDQPEIWKVPFYEQLIPKITVKAPELGYFIPVQHTNWITKKLKLHDIQWEKWTQPAPTGLEVFRASKSEFSKDSFEGRQMLKVEGSWKSEAASFAKGTLFVPINQKKARLAMQLFEPLASDSLVAWGFFNNDFEPKEYMEDYVAEEVAKEMLKDTKIAAEFKERLKDKEFAKDPAQRFNFFYRKHSSWDVKFNMYPILRK